MDSWTVEKLKRIFPQYSHKASMTLTSPMMWWTPFILSFSFCLDNTTGSVTMKRIVQLVKLCLIKLKQEITITVWVRCIGADWYFVQKVPFKQPSLVQCPSVTARNSKPFNHPNYCFLLCKGLWQSIAVDVYQLFHNIWQSLEFLYR